MPSRVHDFKGGWMVLKIRRFDESFEVANVGPVALNVSMPDEEPRYYCPVYETRELALEMANGDERLIYQVGPAQEARQ